MQHLAMAGKPGNSAGYIYRPLRCVTGTGNPAQSNAIGVVAIPVVEGVVFIDNTQGSATFRHILYSVGDNPAAHSNCRSP